MFSWIKANIGSIVVAAALLIMVASIVCSMIVDRKAGRYICGGSVGSCAGGCAGCPMHGKCHGR